MVQVILSDNFYDDISKHYIVSCWSIHYFDHFTLHATLSTRVTCQLTCRDAADSAPACVWTQGGAAGLSWAPAPANNHSYSLHLYFLTIVFLTGLRWRKNKYRPDLECSTAFSINSTTVGLLNRVKLPKLKFPAKTINRLNDFVTCETSRVVTLIMLYSDVSDKSVEFEGETEDVVVVAAVPHHEAAVWLPGQDPLRGLAGQWTPVPASLKSEASSVTRHTERRLFLMISSLTSFTLSMLAAKSMLSASGSGRGAGCEGEWCGVRSDPDSRPGSWSRDSASPS